MHQIFLALGSNIVNIDEELEIPHPLLQERDFVLQPLSDINPGFFHPVLKKTMRALLDTIPGEQRSVSKMLK